MSTAVVSLPNVTSLRLLDSAVAVPALSSHVRPALVLMERETRELLATAHRYDVGNGGTFSAGPAGIQVWSGPFDGDHGAHGSARHLGSVDWSYNSPNKHYAIVYRAMVTVAGMEAGESTATILARVLALTGYSMSDDRLDMPVPPPRDPFHSTMAR